LGLLSRARKQAVVVALCVTGSAFAQGDTARGKELFKTCAGCHNTANDERKMGPSLRTLFGKVTLRNGKHVDDDNVREIVLDGFNGMPPFRYSFRPAEIDDVMAYLHTLTGKPTEAASGEGEKFFRAYCMRCHNPDSRTAAGPDLRGRFRAEWIDMLNEGHAGAPALKEWLDAPSRLALADFLKKY
jgi:cytochrome c2